MTKMKFRAFVFAAGLVLPAAAQEKEKVPAAEAEVLFLRAFYLDKGERRFDEAVELYRKFLDAAPDHRYAAPAARNAFGLLNRTGKVEEANKLREAHAKLLDRVPVADREPGAGAQAGAGDRPGARGGGAGAEPAAGQADARREQMAQRLADLKERLETARNEGDEQQVERLTAQIKRLEEAIAGGGAGRGPGAGRGAGGGRGGQPQKPLTEMSAEELASFQERMKPLVERMVARLRENGDDAGADKLNASYEKAIGLIKEGKLEEAEKIRAELTPRRRRGG
jgi:TolA-binding protein